MDLTSSLGEFEGDGVLVEVSIELFHGEGIDILACLVLDIPRDEGFLECDVEFVTIISESGVLRLVSFVYQPLAKVPALPLINLLRKTVVIFFLLS